MSSPRFRRRDALVGGLTVMAGFGASARTVAAPSSCSAMTSVSRGYVQGRYGQIHLRLGNAVDSNATPLLCIHGFPDSGRIFEQLVRQLQSRRTVIAPDLPGCGNSDVPQSRPDIADYADAVAEVLESLRAPTVDVLALAEGTSIAIELAQRHPHLVRTLVLVPLSGRRGDSESPWPPEDYPRLATPDGRYLTVAWRWHMSRGMQQWRETAARNQYPDVVRHPRNSWWGPASAAGHDWLTAMGRVDQPVLLIETGEDTSAPGTPNFQPTADARIVARPGWQHGFPDVRTTEVIELLTNWPESDV